MVEHRVILREACQFLVEFSVPMWFLRLLFLRSKVRGIFSKVISRKGLLLFLFLSAIEFFREKNYVNGLV